MIKKFIVFLSICICAITLISCSNKDTYKLAKKMYNYKLNKTGYDSTLSMARNGNYDANCKDCFIGIDTSNISLFGYACEVDFEIAKAIYENGADIEVTNSEFYRSPLLSALNGNRNNNEIVYWLIEQGADIDSVDFNNCCVFHYLRYWDNSEETQELIRYFIDNCDLKLLEERTSGNLFCSWDEMWDEENQFVFY